jgi:hypothetical protein
VRGFLFGIGSILRPPAEPPSDPAVLNSNADPTDPLCPGAANALAPPNVAGCVNGLAAGEPNDCGGLKGLATAGLIGVRLKPLAPPNPPADGGALVALCPKAPLAVPLPPKPKGDGVGAGEESLAKPPKELLGAPNPVFPLLKGCAEFGALANPPPLLLLSFVPNENPDPDAPLKLGPPGVFPPRIGLVSIPSNSSTLVNGVRGPEGKRRPLVVGAGGAFEGAGPPNENPVVVVGVGVGVALDD